MANIFKFLAVVLLIGFVVTKISGICKWVDENGVVHYAETCPEDVNTTDVQIHKPPSQEQVEATTRRSEKIREDTQARSDRRQQEKEQQALERQAREDTREVMTDQCAEAKWNLYILQIQLPVYIDEENSFHFNTSLHANWYTGKRTYLDDPHRQAEIAHYTRVETETCTTSEADIRARIMKYREKHLKDTCGHLRNELENMQRFSTGIPSDKMRDLEEVMKIRCKY